MEGIKKQHHWTPLQLKKINACQLHTQVTYITEISVNGKTLDQHITKLQQEQYTENTHTTQEWPTQARPETKSWKLWKAAILTLVGTDKRMLRTPVVGYWHTHTQHTRNWTYHYHHQEQKITNTTTHQEYKQTQSNRRTT